MRNQIIGRVNNPETVIAAYGVGDKLINIIFIVVDGLGTGIMTLIGQNLGANLIERVKEIAKKSLQVVFLITLMIGFMSFSLPSGLTLYWFTSTLLGIGQQYLINKQVPTTVEAPKKVVLDKKEKPTDKKPVAPKEEPWIPGYEGVDGGNPSGGKTKTKKYKKGRRR